MKEKDVIRWVIDCMVAHEPRITEELAMTVELQSRAHWGGQEVRVRKTVAGNVGRPPKVPAIGADGAPPASAHMMRRADLYGLLKRGPK